MDPFVYNGLPARVIFGVGSLEHLSREIGLLGQAAPLYCRPRSSVTRPKRLRRNWGRERRVCSPKR